MEQAARPVVIFDGVCNLCNHTVDLLLRLDRSERLLFASNQSEAGQRLLGDVEREGDSATAIYLVEPDRTTSESTAALRILLKLGWPWRLLYGAIVIPRPIRDTIYRWIARNRYRWFGKKDSCRLPTAEEAARFVG